MPVLRGSIFARGTDPDATPSILISRTLAEKLWPKGEDPIGRSAYLGGGQHVHDCSASSATCGSPASSREPVPAMYFPSWLTLWETMTIVVRAEGDPATLAGRCAPPFPRDRAQPIFDVETMRGHCRSAHRRAAAERDAAGDLRRARADAGGRGSRRRDGVCGRAADVGTGGPPGARRVAASGDGGCDVQRGEGLVAGIAAGARRRAGAGSGAPGLLYGVAAARPADAVGDVPSRFRRCRHRLLVAARRATRISPTLAQGEQ